MKKVLVKTNQHGYVDLSMEVSYTEPGDLMPRDGYDGVFEIPDDFGENQHLYRLINGELVIDNDMVIRAQREKRECESIALRRMRADELIKQTQATSIAQDAEPNDVIALSVYLPEWGERAYEAGYIVTYENQPYRCVQAHDATSNPGWNPANTPNLWAKYHATSAEYALDWAQPTGAHDAYQEDEYMAYTDGIVYRCKANDTIHGPDTLPGAWESI